MIEVVCREMNVLMQIDARTMPQLVGTEILISSGMFDARTAHQGVPNSTTAENRTLCLLSIQLPRFLSVCGIIIALKNSPPTTAIKANLNTLTGGHAISQTPWMVFVPLKGSDADP